MLNVLFLCAGNICRSPLAEGVFADLVARAGLQTRLRCDSAGTGNWHAGDLADHRSRKVAEQHGLVLTHRARQITAQDFVNFDYILAMDQFNLADVRSVQNQAGPRAKAQLQLLRHYDPAGPGEVADPYYGDLHDFEVCYQTVKRCSEAFLAHLQQTQLV
ncbi:MAG: low molecular weight phosphotyrosine protein phosphatase [Bernardetiaceae bacterium]|jgi:protein-tyrosine phosphatase|nr:low molecular weight phosphotyrosine protein phosphatase [Bernardetiaceae bacterium]